MKIIIEVEATPEDIKRGILTALTNARAMDQTVTLRINGRDILVYAGDRFAMLWHQYAPAAQLDMFA